MSHLEGHIRKVIVAALAAGILSIAAVAIAAAHEDHSTDEWPMTCVDLNDVVEEHLGNDHNVGIYQNTFGDQAEAACQNDHRNDVRGVFAWAFGDSSSAPTPSVPTASLPLVDPALYSAVWRGRTEQVRALVAGGVNVNVRTSDNDPLLYEGIWRNHVEIVRILVDAGADVDQRDADNDPVLHEAIWRGHTDVVRSLVDAGADVDAKDSDDDPVLYEAIFRGHTEIVRILVNAGVDVNANDSRGRSALNRALFWAGDDSEIVRILLEAQPAQTDLAWPTDCVELNDIVENHLGNDSNVGIYQSVFGDQAEQGCRGDHREDVRSVFGWAFNDGT